LPGERGEWPGCGAVEGRSGSRNSPRLPQVSVLSKRLTSTLLHLGLPAGTIFNAAYVRWTMKRQVVEVLAGVVLWSGMGLCAGDEAGAPTDSPLTNAAQVHALAPEVARQSLPARLEGVVTHYRPRFGDRLFCQDATDGVYVHIVGAGPDVRVGDRIRIEGVTEAGDYAPVVRLRHLEKLGRGELPKAEVVTAAALATGKYDSRRVEVRGIVRSAAPSARLPEGHLALHLRSDGKDLLIGVNDYSPASTNLVDAEVIARGVTAGVFSWQRQLIEPVVVVDSDQDLEVVSPPQVLDRLPVKTIESLFRYAPSGFPERRVRLRGQLLGRQPGKWLAVRDGTSGLFVEPENSGELSPGSEVEVFGFPEMREQTLWLVKAIVRRAGQGSAPAVVASSVTNALRHPCELHRIEGVLAGPPRPGTILCPETNNKPTCSRIKHSHYEVCGMPKRKMLAFGYPPDCWKQCN
jgi:hypothetical protein